MKTSFQHIDQVRSPQPLPKRGKTLHALRRHALRTVSAYVLLTAVAILMATPFIWMLLSSVKPNEELFAYPPVWIPTQITFQHYVDAFASSAFTRYFLNSFYVSAVTTAANLFFCSLAGYAFARLEFPGKNVIFFALLGTMMIPIYVTIIPLFIIVKSIPLAGGNNWLGQGGTGWIDTYAGLMFPYFMNVFGVFLMRQFFATIPTELNDAARIDGASEFAIYRRIYIPLSKPVMATLGIFSFTSVWDDFLWPLIITNSQTMRTVQLGLQVFQTEFTVRWGPLMAATLVVTLPVLLVFILGQKYFIEGFTTTGIKG